MNPRLPKIVENLLPRLVKTDCQSSILLDFQDQYEAIIEEKNVHLARLWCFGQVVKILYGKVFNTLYWGGPMFMSYLKTALRNMKRHKGFTIINISGLAIGMAACLVMLMFVIHEISFDEFHEHKDRIYRAIADWGREGSRMRFAGSMPGIAPVLPEEIPEIETAARIRKVYQGTITIEPDTELKAMNVLYADPDIFRIFSWKLLQGDQNAVLTEPYTAILSERMVSNYFPEGEPLGKTIMLNGIDFAITGVLRDIPPNTHLACDVLLSYVSIEASGDYPQNPWNVWGDDHTYFLLRESAAATEIDVKLEKLLVKNSGEWFAGMMTMIAQPLSNIHWDTVSRADLGPKGNRTYVTIFSSAALLVLLIACFNFMNLSTSGYIDRMKEVGIRKVIGAGRRQLILQFLSESILLFFAAVMLAFILFAQLSTFIYTLLGAEVILTGQHLRMAALIVLFLVVVLSILAGLYPALFLSRFKPVDIMKNAVTKKHSPSFRTVSVIMQYAVTTILIIGTIIIYRQLDFVKHSELGFEKEDAVLLGFPFNDDDAAAKYPVLRDQLLNHPDVIDVSGAYTVPGVNSQYQISLRKPGSAADDFMTCQALPGDFGFVKALGLEIVDGRDFSRAFSTDGEAAVILNESAVRILGLENPVGQKLVFPRNRKRNVESTIVGIARDFHVKSLHEEIDPMMLFIEPRMFGTMIVKLKNGFSDVVVDFFEETWKEVLPFAEYNMRFMEDAYYRFYATEEKTGKLITIFACLAGFVSCLGLFGLASFSASKRIKEIGIRKVLGATSGSVTLLLSRQFTKWVLISNILAWPAAYLIFSRWLNNFVYRIDINVGIFLLSGLLAWLVSLLTVGYHAMKAATADPVVALKYE